MNEAKLKERGLCDQLSGLGLIGRRKAGQLDHDLILTHRPYVRLDHAAKLIVHTASQHFHRLGQGTLLLDPIGGVHLHLDEEGGTALQIEAELDLTGGIPLQLLHDQVVHLLGRLLAAELVVEVIGQRDA